MAISHRLPFASALPSIALVAVVCGVVPTPAAAQLVYTTLHEFAKGPGGVKGRLIQAADGHIYGTASEGGLYSGGVVYVMHRTTTGWLPPATLHDFHPSEGIKPLAGLTEGAPGVLYGTTSEAGARGGGALFALAVTGQFRVLHALNRSTDGGTITGELTRLPDGSFYGTALSGGPYDRGTAFTMTASGVFTRLVSFSGPNGSQPSGALALGLDGNLYGVTRSGGAYNYGSAFRLTRAGTLTTVHSFQFNCGPIGGCSGFGLPTLGLTFAWDGSFYGVATETTGGGDFTPVLSYPGLFRMTMVGEVTRLPGPPTERPDNHSALTLADDGWLYGTTYSGEGRVVVRIWPVPFTIEVGAYDENDPFGTGLAGISFEDILAAPLAATDGQFYTVSNTGSLFGHGAIVTFAGTGPLRRLHAFENDGFVPTGTLIKSPDGNLYGTTYFGGWADTGTVFRVSNTGAVSRVGDLIGDYGGHFFGSVLETSDGLLVATSPDHPTAVTKTGEATRWNAAGVNNGVVEVADGYLYGSLPAGYDAPSGGIYRFGPDHWELIHAFQETEGSTPIGGLVLAGDGYLYGTTSEGGASGFGTIFRCALDGTLTTLHHFNGDDGAFATATLVEGSDGLLYGTTLLGGDRTLVPQGAGTVFSISKDGHFTSLHAFTGSDGAFPVAGLSLGSGGWLYGTAIYGGLGTGTVFAIRPDGAFGVLHRFEPGQGARPFGSVTEANGALYGTTSAGGRPGRGVLYRLGTF